MKALRIQLKGQGDYELLVQLIQSLGIKVTEVQEDAPNNERDSQKMADILEDLAANGGVSIEAPSAWQNHLRTDRSLS
jgi:hypothetical protein